jgi:hypothetical protein
MRRIVILLGVLALVAAACGSNSADDTTVPTTTVAGDQAGETATSEPDATTTTLSSTTTAATTTTASATTTVAASGGLESCVVGTWELDSQEFFDTLLSSLPEDEQVGEFMFVDGAYLLIVEADGTFRSVRDGWTFGAESEDGEVVLRISDEQTGTYSLDGSVLTTRLEAGTPAEIEIIVDGVALDLPGGRAPFEPPAAEFEGAVVSCDGDVMSSAASDEPFAATWRRVG